jgi:manganese transport protein
MTTAEEQAVQPQVKTAPSDFVGILRQLGPGLIISAVIVGSGELIVTPKVGAENGFTMLWFIVFGCCIKVFVQIELGRFALSKGMTTLEAMNLMPGPRWRVSWLLWLWVPMYVALIFQVAGMVGALGSVFSLAGIPLEHKTLAVVVAASCAALLVVGRYKMVEVLCTALVVIFTIATLVAVGAVQTTEYAITAKQLVDGFKFQLPSSPLAAFAAFGIIGVGASELIYYPYWCLEKGYARSVGRNDESPGWVVRARGWIRMMKIDAWVSFVIYTTATLAFYLLGASILHARGLIVENDKMIPTLSYMYRSTFGEWSYWVFLVGAFAVLYSTVFGATASNARLLADALSIFGFVKYPTLADRQRMIRNACIFLPAAFAAVYLLVGQPVTLVFVGAIAQAVMLPFLSYAALYFHYRHTHPGITAGKLWLAGVWLASVAMTLVGGYQIYKTLFGN